MKLRVTITLLLLLLAACQHGEHESVEMSDHQAHIAEMGAEVMPFDLDRTTHIFEKIDDGGLQQVVSDDEDDEQIALIRQHLAEEAEKFAVGDFHDPQMIHGENMAGIHELVMGAERLNIVYSDIPDGGQILYTTDDEDLVLAIHAWFEQQLTDHGMHAQPER